jgi:cytochrome c oxidase subunit IV
MSKPLKIVLKILGILFLLFTGTFIIYFFNLDMKLTSMIEPFLLKHYDNIPRNRHL